MYNELGHFCCRVLKQKTVWLSGEFLTSLTIGCGSFVLFHYVDIDKKIIDACYNNLANLLTVVSIIFGFALSSFLFYVQIADSWVDDQNVKKIVGKIVDWNAWTVICILFLMTYMLVLLVANNFIGSLMVKEIIYAFLFFLISYCILQLVCHTLLIWWTFQNRDRLRKP